MVLPYHKPKKCLLGIDLMLLAQEINYFIYFTSVDSTKNLAKIVNSVSKDLHRDFQIITTLYDIVC